jgi:hypothetical protein
MWRINRLGKAHTVQAPGVMRAGVKIGHSRPRERCVAAE